MYRVKYIQEERQVFCLLKHVLYKPSPFFYSHTHTHTLYVLYVFSRIHMCVISILSMMQLWSMFGGDRAIYDGNSIAYAIGSNVVHIQQYTVRHNSIQGTMFCNTCASFAERFEREL